MAGDIRSARLRLRLIEMSIRVALIVYGTLVCNHFGRAVTTAGERVNSPVPYIALQIPSHRNRRAALRRMAAIAQAAHPINTKTVPEMISMSWPRNIASA